MYTAFPCSDYYGSSAPTSPASNRRQVFPALMAGTDEVVPTFTLEPFNGVGAQLSDMWSYTYSLLWCVKFYVELSCHCPLDQRLRLRLLHIKS